MMFNIHLHANVNHVSRFRAMKRKLRKGLSLLEVMLTLAILGVAVAILSQAMNLAADNGIRAKELMSAQLAGESKMAEIVAGAVPMSTGAWTPIVASGSSKSWYFQVTIVPAEQPNMKGVQVAITDSPNGELRKPIDYKLVRWIIDPELGLDKLPDPNAQGSNSGSSTGSSGGTTGSNAGGTR